MYEIREHPDAPGVDELHEYLLEAVPPEEIRRRRESGDELLETNLLELDAVDAYVELEPDPMAPGDTDIGTALYRLVQLFGTPNVRRHVAGEDISNRTDTTFTYLLAVSRQDEPAEWLVTVHDWHVRLGVSVAGWASELDGEAPAVDPETAVSLLALVTNVVTEPVHCEYEEIVY